jgi:hypothetical protein
MELVSSKVRKKKILGKVQSIFPLESVQGKTNFTLQCCLSVSFYFELLVLIVQSQILCIHM